MIKQKDFLFLFNAILVMCILVTNLNTFAQDSAAAEPPKKVVGLQSADGKTNFAQANPEDITNENFPNLIESFDYPNAQLSEVVKAISKLTGKNFILEKNVGGTISIIAPSQITVAEAYNAFLTALAMNNLVVVPSGKFLKIRQISQATREAIDTFAGNYFPNSDQFITRIVKLKYINAEEVEKTISPLINSQGSIKTYSPTNSLIITDFGSNIERIVNILNQLDVPGFEEKLVVIPIKFARSKDIADLIDQIINKGDKNKSQFSSGIPRFRSGGSQSASSGSGAANFSLVIPDSRTNSIIVVGNDGGIARIRGLVAKLDFRLKPEDAGGVNVYYVRYGEAEKISNVLGGIATESTKSKSQANSSATSNAGSGIPGAIGAAPVSQAVFGGDVKVTPDKENNALIITASKQDYEIVRTILAKIDIPRDQVFVKAIIMEMGVNNATDWGVNYYKFAEGGVGRAGFVTSSVSELLDPTKDSGLVFGFGSGSTVEVKSPGAASGIEVPSLLSFIKFLKKNNSGNILSTPQISAIDNEEALIEVGDNVPVSLNVSTSSTGQTAPQVDRKDLTLKLKITPFISPDTDSLRLKIEQEVKQLSAAPITADELSKRAIAYSTRTINTSIIVNSNDTAVLGGLMSDNETENVNKVPILGDIPILGWLFKSKNVSKAKKNLIVFITPKIIRNAQDSSDLLDQKLNERIDFIQQNMKGRDPYGYEIDRMPRRSLVESPTDNFIPDNQSPSVDATEPAPETEQNDGVNDTDGIGNEGLMPGDYEESE